MPRDLPLESWTPVCTIDQIVPNTGVCALLKDQQVALFHVGARVYAIGNYDPNSNAAVLSRGLVGSVGERVVVASPLYKHHFDLETGECLEAPEHSVPSYLVRVEAGRVWVGA
jgi:nitrite reductase (NADH) small subunit